MNLEKIDPRRIEPIKDSQRPFSKINFYLMAICLAMIVVGFLLMSGSPSVVDGKFNPEIFSTRRIIVGPAISFLGFLFMAFAIVWQPKKLRSKGNDADGKEVTDGLA